MPTTARSPADRDQTPSIPLASAGPDAGCPQPQTTTKWHCSNTGNASIPSGFPVRGPVRTFSLGSCQQPQSPATAIHAAGLRFNRRGASGLQTLPGARAPEKLGGPAGRRFLCYVPPHGTEKNPSPTSLLAEFSADIRSLF